MAARSSIPTHPQISPSILEEIGQAGKSAPEPEWQVVVYDTDTNTYEEVMTVLVIATACTVEEAYIEAWEIDHYGSCIVYRATEAECRDAAEIIKTIEIPVEVRPAE